MQALQSDDSDQIAEGFAVLGNLYPIGTPLPKNDPDPNRA